MFKFNVGYFMSLFEEFDKNELEIYSIINGMTEEDLHEFITECDKNMDKYYTISYSVEDVWYNMKKIKDAFYLEQKINRALRNKNKEV